MKKANLTFVDFIVPSFAFEKTFILEKDELILEPTAFISRNNEQFHINIKLEIKDLESEFILKILAIGTFKYDTDREEELLSFVSINGPAIIFPYIRSFIASTTSQTGLNTITLPTLNLSGYKEELIANMVDLDTEGE
ncbi:protein-export chaperone SecB [uncultured Dokdonia sp.]|uniref:protein-export chaperone SecB n=1 Tax=uncultured Dokdonia sp. TaxID=575653 RepID=UPI002632E457|nr:protein-export chaperone SecB [uncultured Dokdonia sp.]